mgnify:CR=1 FL=1
MKSFQTLGVVPELIDSLAKQGIKEPTPIQEQAIPPAFKGNDLIAMAQTGTGKTLAFLIPVLQRINIEVFQEQALIIAPTRELVNKLPTKPRLSAIFWALIFFPSSAAALLKGSYNN